MSPASECPQMDACALERQLPPPRGVIKTLETALERLLDCSEVFDPSHHCNCNAGACGCGLTAAEATAHDFSRCPPGFWTPTCPAAVWKITESELNHLLRDLIHARNGSPNSRGNKERLECLKAMYRTSLTQREHCRPNELLLLIKQQYLEVHRPGGGNSR